MNNLACPHCGNATGNKVTHEDRGHGLSACCAQCEETWGVEIEGEEEGEE
jgi:hypothetical protein